MSRLTRPRAVTAGRVEDVTAPQRDTGSPSRVRKFTQQFDARTWSGALAWMLLAVTVLWVIEIVDATTDHRLDRYGLRPRTLRGLDGIVTMPFLHSGAAHLIANTAPFVIIGWMVLVGGPREFLLATAIIVVGGGALTWVVGPNGVIVGASALVFGWLAYLLGRAYFARKVMWIVAAAFALFFFSGLFSGLVPTVKSNVSWQAHLCGFLAGLGAAWLLHPRKGSARAIKRRPVT